MHARKHLTREDAPPAGRREPPVRKPGDPRFGLGVRPSPCRESARSKTAMNEPGKSDKPVVPEKPANMSESMSFWELFEQVKRVEGRKRKRGHS